MTPLPLLDLVELGCEFPLEIELAEKPELLAEDVAGQPKDAAVEQPAEATEQVIVDPTTEHMPQADVID